MSYWFHIATPEGDELYDPVFDDQHPGLAPPNGAGATVMVAERGYVRCGNYTSNVSGMWTRCLTAALEVAPYARAWVGNDDEGSNGRLYLRDLDDQRCGDLVDLLAAAVVWGVNHIEELRELNPENSWGDAEGAVTYLWDMQRACEQYPDGTLGISS